MNATGTSGALKSFNGSLSIGGRVTAEATDEPIVEGGNMTGSAAVSTGQDAASTGSITVTGHLTISSKFAGMWTTGTGNINIDGGTVEMENIPYGLLTRMGGAASGGDLSIANEAKILMKGVAMGTFPQGASALTVDSSTVEIEAASWGLYWPGLMTLKNSTVICTTNYSAIGTNYDISYEYPGGYVFLAGDTADAAQEISQSEQKTHLGDKYVKIAPVTVPVTGIALDKTALTLTPGGTATLDATVTPENATDKTVTWGSSAPGVAAVDTSGTITAIAPGTAVITAAADGQSAQCTVTVNGAVPPASDTDDSEPTYSITLPTKTTGGQVKVSPRYAEQDSTVTLTVTLDEGWELAELAVTSKNGTGIELTDKGDGKFTFTMPGWAVTVEAVFTKVDEPQPWNNPFTDVQDGAWYSEAVQYVYENNLMTGTGAATFSPDAAVNRGMLITILWRIEGNPVVDYLMDFEDVDPIAYYGEAIRWAADTGVAVGYGNGYFGPNDPVTREQLAVMLYRYAVHSGMDAVPLRENLNGFVDSGSVSPYAVQALNWAVGEGIITGKGNQILDPKGQATRAQAAVMLQRYLENR